jgi:hypothetical protein
MEEVVAGDSPSKARNRPTHIPSETVDGASLPSRAEQPPAQAAKGEIAIIGGGPAGACMALILASKGFIVDVYEKRLDPRSTSASTTHSG